MRSSGTVGCGAENRYTFTWMRLFSGEGRGNRSLASRLSLAARLSRPRPDSGRPRPPRCESVTVITGTPSHRYGYRGGGSARDWAADGTAEADAAGEAPGNRRPGRVLIRRRSLQESRTPSLPATTGTAHIVPAAAGWSRSHRPGSHAVIATGERASLTASPAPLRHRIQDLAYRFLLLSVDSGCEARREGGAGSTARSR